MAAKYIIPVKSFLLISGFLLFMISMVACDKKKMTLSASVSMSKIKGTVAFTQHLDPTKPTTINFNLDGIIEELNVQVHSLPMIYKGNAKTSCNSLAIGSVYNPTGSEDGSCSTSNQSRCMVGDISGKIGNINQFSPKNYTDKNLPLSGKNGIYGRTLVFKTTSGVVKACALIDRSFGPGRTATAQFKGPVAGTVYFRQVVEGEVTLMYVNLFFVNNSVSKDEFYLEVHDTPVSEKISADQCSNVGAIYNPFKVNRDHCNKTNHAGCPVGDLLTKDGPVNVTGSTSDLSSTQVAYTDANLPINGWHAIIGHSLVLYRRSDPTRPVSCANIVEVFRRIAKAFFNPNTADGVDGIFIFKQASPFDQTTVEIRVLNMRSKAEGFHVHEYPNPVYKSIKTNVVACSLAVAGDHLNPYGIISKDSPPNGAGTFDEYEIGDLSAKYGSFLNQNNSQSKHIDLNLPLFGKYSIIGRSLVIHNLKNDGNKRWVCSNIELKSASSVTFNSGSLEELTKPTEKTVVISHFTGPNIKGDILMEQCTVPMANGAPFDTTIYLDLVRTSGDKSPNHNWHVHEKSVGQDMSTGKCLSPGPHYNPYHVYVEGNYKSTCTPNNPLRCELGDSSAKTAQYSLGSGAKFYTDVDTPLSGEHSVVGRSFVIHVKDGGAARQGCADIKTYSPKSESSASHVTGMLLHTVFAVILLVVLI